MEVNTTMPGVVQPKAATSKMNLLMGLMALCILAGVASGVYAQVVGHQHAFANTREMPWGLLIGVYAYLAIISTGLCLMAVISHLFHVQRLAPLANRMVWLAMIMLMGAFTVIGLEIENPWRMPLGMVFHPNLTSNIWWMGTLYGIAVGLLIVEFFLIYTGKLKAALAFGVMGAIAEMLANSNLGSVFASLSARPFWYGAQLPIFFLCCALLSGASAVILFTHYAHVLRRRRMRHETFEGLRTAGKIMVVMLFFVGLATAWKFANAYCGTADMQFAADALVKGPLSTSFWLFEVGLGIALPFLLLVFTRLHSLQAMSLAALLVLVGQMFSRFNLVVGGLIVPQYLGYDNLPRYLSYSPSPAEYLLALGGLGVVGFAFLLGEKKFSRVFWSAEEQEELIDEQQTAWLQKN